MKKILLFIILFHTSTEAYTQQNLKVSGRVCMSEKLARKFAASSYNEQKKDSVRYSEISEKNNSNLESNAVTSNTIQWQIIGTSPNIHSMLISQSKPLQYTDEINAVTFMHRKGSNYNALPFNNSGAIICRITNNWGSTWDSSCIWSNNNQIPMSVQGGIYNPPQNFNLQNSYLIGMGPVMTGTNISGNFYASKKAGSGNYDATASQTLDAQQFISNTAPFQNNLTKHDYSRNSFCSTDDGAVRSLAGRYSEYVNGKPKNFRGAAIIKGTFNAGVFSWTSDTLIPAVVTRTNNTKQLWEQSIMAWNEAGTLGYIVFIGTPTSAVASNKGWQPIIFKTTNSGASWSNIPGIDFNDVSMSQVLSHIDPVSTNTTLTIPFFNVNEGIDATIDINGKLHIVSTIVGTSSSHDDSLDYVYQYGGLNYHWPHTPGKRPYLYDFVGDGSSIWKVNVIDSLPTEAPATTLAEPGFTSNPWSMDPLNNNMKVSSDSRIQLSRTSNGEYIIYTWAESDTAFTPSQQKWNTIPNIKARCSLSLQGFGGLTISSNEINISKPTTTTAVTNTINPKVASKATFHYVAPKSIYVNCIHNQYYTSYFKVPIIVSNNVGFSQFSEVNHWYSSATIGFDGVGKYCVGSEENSIHTLPLSIYPNPAQQNAFIKILGNTSEKLFINVYNALWQKIKTQDCSGNESEIEIDLKGIPSGIYFIEVRSGNKKNIKKLIKE